MGTSIGVVDFRQYFDSQLVEINSLKEVKNMLEEMGQKQKTLSERHSYLSEQLPVIQEKAKKEVKQRLDQIQRLKTERNDLEKRAKDHLQQIEPLFSTLQANLDEIQILEASKQYLTILATSEDLYNEIQSYMNEGKLVASLKTCLNLHSELVNLSSAVEESVFNNLKEYVTSKAQQAFTTIESCLASLFKEAYENIGWPPTKNQLPKKPTPENMKKFKEVFSALIDLQNPSQETQNEVPLLPLKLLLEPVSKRFTYYFEMKRNTNRRDKPKWYLAFILDLINSQTLFLYQDIQPLLNEKNLEFIDAKVEFMKILIENVKRKLKRDIPFLFDTPQILSHTINEVLIFQQTLVDAHGFPFDDPGCIAVFIDNDDYFQQWIDLEADFAKKKFQELVDSENRWRFQYEQVSQILEISDDVKATVFVENFLVLLESLTDRFRNLPDPQRLLFFEEVPCMLIEKYLEESEMVRKQLTDQKQLENYVTFCKHLNSIAYCKDILTDWGEQQLFLDLWQYKCLQQNLSEESIIKGMVFGDYIDQLAMMIAHMMDDLVTSILRQFNQALYSYYRMRTWSKKKRFEIDVARLDVSPQLYEPLAILKLTLATIHQNLASEIFFEICTSTARHSGELFIKFVKQQQFDEHGAAQLFVDCNAIFTLFSPYTSKPQNYFRRLKECLQLLNLPEDHEIITIIEGVEEEKEKKRQSNQSKNKGGKKKQGKDQEEENEEEEEDNQEVMFVLEKLGITSLKYQEVLDILSRKVVV